MGSGQKSRKALTHFLTTYREVLVESQGMSLVEVCRLILDRTRAWQDIDALPPTARLTAKLNLHRLLDLAEDWSPLSGRPSLTAFLDYLDLMEDEPAEELDSAHLSGEDAVTLVTIHRAKGLEWDVVAVPAVVDRNFPSRSQQFPDPARFPEYLPVEHRIDTALAGMPDDEKARTAYSAAASRVAGVAHRLRRRDPGAIDAVGHRQLLVRAARAEHDPKEAVRSLRPRREPSGDPGRRARE